MSDISVHRQMIKDKVQDILENNELVSIDHDTAYELACRIADELEDEI